MASSGLRPHGLRPLVGRADELARLAALIEQVRQGVGSLAVVEGEPGIGKTRLVDEAVALVRERGWQVARGNGEELGRERPFGLVADALGLRRGAPDPERARLAELLVGSPGSAPASPLLDLRFHLVESICDLVEREAARQPVVLVAEDVHWGDSSSLLTLHRLCGRVRPLPVLVVVTTRPGSRGPELAQLLAALESAGAMFLRLPPLANDAVVQLAEGILGTAIGPRLREELTRAAGNPLFALELVEALRREQSIKLREGVAELEHAVEPAPSLRLTILRRLSFLSEETLQLLQLASVLGATFSLDELAAVTGRRPSDLLTIVREAVAAGFLVDAGEQLAFRHDLVRDALYLDIPRAARSAVHGQAGRALAAAGAPARLVAVHLSLSASPGDEEAVEWLRRAALEVAPSGPATAIGLLERALELLPRDARNRDEVETELILPLLWSGRLAEAEAHARDALARTTDVALATQLYRLLLTALFLNQRMPALADVCEEALSRPDLPPTDRAFFLSQSTIALLALGRVDETLARADAAIAAGREAGAPVAILFATWAHGQVELLRGRYAKGVETLARLVGIAERSAVTHGYRVGGLSVAGLRLGISHLMTAWGLLAADRAAEAAESLGEARVLFEEAGAFPYACICHRSLASARFALGEWDDALAESQSAWLLAEETGVHGMRAHQGDPAPLVHLHRGEVGQAEDELAKIERALGREAPLLVQLWLLPQKALVTEARGDHETALRLLEQTLELAARLDIVPDYRLFGPTLVRLALAAGRRELAARAAEEAGELARRAGGLARADGVALLCRGMLADEADLLGAAVTVYRGGAPALDLALACEEAGAAFGRRGRRTEAVSLLEEALDVFERLTAAHDVARARQRLRALGVRRRARVRRGRDRSGWESVTPSELKVVELVALGLSNPDIAQRLYVSRRTVRAHLESVFRKLDVSSRAELAAVAARRAAPPRAESAR